MWIRADEREVENALTLVDDMHRMAVRMRKRERIILIGIDL